MPIHQVLIGGAWRPANATGSVHAFNPTTGQSRPDEYPISAWSDCDAALEAASTAATALREISPEKLAGFLTRYADRLDAASPELVEIAHTETALARQPRLKDVELPRTTKQLRQAAAAAIEGSWSLPTIDTALNIRSCHAPIGPVVVFGPNNFPFAYNGISGGDFAAAIAAGNPVIAKAHPLHPCTTRLLAAQCLAALDEAGLPKATVQLIYHVAPSDGLRLVSDPRIGAIGFTGSRSAGLALKAAADAAGKPIYLEMSSLNPVVVLPAAITERTDAIADQYTDSCLMGAGQFCTKPGLLFLITGQASETFIEKVKQRFTERSAAPLLGATVAQSLEKSVKKLAASGATVLVGGSPQPEHIGQFANTLLRVDGAAFLRNGRDLQTEAFGNASMIVIARDLDELCELAKSLEGQLTGSIYSATGGGDDAAYIRLAPILRRRVGRLLNDKMPTGVAVTSAMNHGGPYPATGHPGFTAVGIPASLRRFSQLECYDNVRPDRVPAILRNQNPTAKTWRLIDGTWTVGDIA